MIFQFQLTETSLVFLKHCLGSSALSFGTELTNTAVHSSSSVTFISRGKRVALKILVYFRPLADNWTCQSDISLSLSPNAQNKSEAVWAFVLREKMDLVLPLLQSWGINRAERRPSAHSADVCRVWHSEAIAPSLSSDGEWKLICRSQNYSTANRPVCFNTINLLSFSFSLSQACLPLSGL